MLRHVLLASVAGATVLFDSSAIAQIANQDSGTIETVVVTAQRLNQARNGIQTQTGASTYTITADQIENQPGGANNLLNQIVLQAPSVAQDSFGQLHVRGEHNGLQYRLNGVIIPEGISVFGQTLSPRLISSMQLITGALPAEYGLRTAGIIDLTTRAGTQENGGEVSIYGGSHGTIQPSFNYGGSTGNFSYFVSGDFLHNKLGIESPDGSSTPLHDVTDQSHGFAYLEEILDDRSKVTAVLGTSNDHFEIPNQRGLQPDLGLTVNGQSEFLSDDLEERQRELTHFAILSYLRSQGAFAFQVSGTARYSSLTFTPDPVGDLLFNGISQYAYKRDVTYGTQVEGAYYAGNDHTIRGGIIIQSDTSLSETTSQVLPADCTGSGSIDDPFDCAPRPSTNPFFDVPISIVDNGSKQAWTYSFYLQDEWQIVPEFTLNYGIRFDQFDGYLHENQLSPRINAVWKPLAGTTVHMGYSRYFSPPPIELVGNTSVAKFMGTTASPPLLLNNTPRSERANYFDAGVDQTIVEGVTVGVAAYYKISKNLVDEGQFGAPIILTPFNYGHGRQYGAELTATYDIDPLSAYANFSVEQAMGKDIVSSEFNFDPGDLTYIADNYIHLDHEQYISLSAGASYRWGATVFGADMLVGSGLRRDGAVPNGDKLPAYVQVNLGMNHAFDLGNAGELTARFDVVNLFGAKYEIRDGSGIGVGAPQYGPRRGFFLGLSKTL